MKLTRQLTRRGIVKAIGASAVVLALTAGSGLAQEKPEVRIGFTPKFLKDDFQTYNRIYAEYFKDNLPCRTTVEINCLPTPIAIELKVIATID